MLIFLNFIGLRKKFSKIYLYIFVRCFTGTEIWSQQIKEQLHLKRKNIILFVHIHRSFYKICSRYLAIFFTLSLFYFYFIFFTFFLWMGTRTFVSLCTKLIQALLFYTASFTMHFAKNDMWGSL